MKMHTDCKIVIFVSSSGHCTLQCPYCIVHPVAKKQPSLDSNDMTFLFDTFRQKVFLAFSGKGDFFAGYRKSDRFLSMILTHDVEIGLDVNGILIHEFPELREADLEKIRFINLTMHYQQIKQHRLENVWVKNARILIDRKGNQMLLGTIISPALKDSWEQSLRFYEEEVFAATGKKLVLIRDINVSFSETDEVLLASIAKKFSHMVESVHQEDFANAFKGCSSVLCPAGKSYFRIWNTGEVQGCPMIPELCSSGNLKKREINRRKDLYACTDPMYCDCNIIEGLGKMVFR
ncbi:conserved hypothetical protein [delta proteobacterium NaphS2]|nr:conserved hypothetical protein [delta proteobacterium NaphS2]